MNNNIMFSDEIKSVEVVFKTCENPNSKMTFVREIDPELGSIISFDKNTGKMILNLAGSHE